MNKNFKKISLLLLAIFIAYFGWFLLKPYEYTVQFKLKTLPGTINQTIKFWSTQMDNSKIINQKSLHEISQKIVFQDTTLVFDWKITSINDSLSNVFIGIKDLHNHRKIRIANLFGTTPFEIRIKSLLKNYIVLTNDHLKKIQVKVVGLEEIPPKFCAYVTVKAKQFQKAKGMMQNYGLLNSILIQNNIQLKGEPFLEITNWNMETDSIQYNFCYPILNNDTLLKHPLIKFKQFKSIKALKAIYNGNYMTSDRAWYALLYEAEKKNLKVSNLPIEIFYNNPNMGGDELSWKTEVFLPLNH